MGGFGDQSSTAMVLGNLGVRCAMAMFGRTFTLGVGALALGAALSSSSPENNDQLAASRPYLANVSDKTGPVAARSAFGASVKSGYGYTRGENPLQTFTKEFGSNFANGMITELDYDKGHSLMTSKNAGDSDSDDSYDSGGVNDFWVRNTRGVGVASISTAFRHEENPLDTLGEECAEKVALGQEAEVLDKNSWVSSTATSKTANASDSDETSAKSVNEFWTKSVLGASVASTSRAIRHGENPLDTFGEELVEKMALGGAAKVLETVIENPSQPAEKSKRKRNRRKRKKRQQDF